jgi:hypothetical protein
MPYPPRVLDRLIGAWRVLDLKNQAIGRDVTRGQTYLATYSGPEDLPPEVRIDERGEYRRLLQNWDSTLFRNSSSYDEDQKVRIAALGLGFSLLPPEMRLVTTSVADVELRLGLSETLAHYGWRDETGWPTAESMINYYRSVPDPATVMQLNEIPVAKGRLWLGNILALSSLAGQVETLVSLCRTGGLDTAHYARRVDFWLNDVPSLVKNPFGFEVLSSAADFVVSELEAGRSVLVHCAVGRSRSPAVGALALSRLEGISHAEALNAIQIRMPHARPLTFDTQS